MPGLCLKSNTAVKRPKVTGPARQPGLEGARGKIDRQKNRRALTML